MLFRRWFYTSYPDKAPFSGFKTTAVDLRQEVDKANGIPYDMAKERIVSIITRLSHLYKFT